MKRYNLKKFFNERIIQDDKIASNGCFVFHKDILTANQKKMLDKMDKGESMLERVYDIYNKTVENFRIEDTIYREELKFIPDYVVETTNGFAVHDSKLNVTLGINYYNFFTTKKCELYMGRDIYDALAVAKDREVIGMLLPVRLGENPNLETSYYDYINKK